MEALPPEVWLEVLRLLPRKDLCNMALVCRQARDIASWPPLWTKVSLKKLMFHAWWVKDFLDIPRFSQVHKLDFSKLQLTPLEVTLLLRWIPTSSLTTLDLYGTNLSSVEPDLLSPALHHLTCINLNLTKLTSAQCYHLFSYFQNNPPTQMKELRLKAIKLFSIPPSMLASTISQLQLANLAFTELTSHQLSALFVELALPTSRLQSLELFSVDLSETKPELLGAAVGKLRVVNLSHTRLRHKHLVTIFQEISQSDKLKEINLDFTEVFTLHPSLFSCLAKLTRVSLACTMLAPFQMRALCQKVVEGPSKLEDLDLLDTCLHDVPGDLLAAAASKMARCNMSGTKLSPIQVDTLFAKLDLMVLRELNLDYVNLSRVPVSSLAGVVSCTEKASLKMTSLSPEAVTAILEWLTNPIPLTGLNLHGVNLSEVSPSLLASSIPSLRYADLSHTSLNLQSATCLFSSLISHNPRLEDLTLLGADLSGIVPSLLADVGKCGLQRLDLSDTQLTQDQVRVLVPSLGPPLQEIILFGAELDTVDQVELGWAKQRLFMRLDTRRVCTCGNDKS